MNNDDRDFYGHGHRRPPSLLVIVGAAFALSLLGAAWWADSNSGATWRAEQVADQQEGETGP